MLKTKEEACETAKAPSAGGVRELLVIALPMVVSHACDTVMTFTDRVFLSRLGPDEMNAAMSGGLTCFMMMTFFMGLIGIIIAMVVNIFLASPMMSWIISAIGVLIFTGLTAYDVQKITRMGEQGIMDGGEAVIRKGAIMGALALYLDFINLFLMLLRLMGDRR